MDDRAQDRVEHDLEFSADVFREKPQHEVTVLLQQSVLASVAPVRNWISEMLRAVQLHGQPCVSA